MLVGTTEETPLPAPEEEKSLGPQQQVEESSGDKNKMKEKYEAKLERQNDTGELRCVF